MAENQEMSNKLDERFQHSAPRRDLMEKGAILQRDGSYAIAPHIPGGVITDPELLIRIANVAKKYNCPALKVTSSQRIAIVGLKEEDIDAAWQDLGIAPGAAIGLCVRSVKFCPGTTFCKRGQQDSVGLGSEIDNRYHGMTLPSKFKISVSGCPNKCMDSMVIDFGVVGMPKGFTIYVGGNGGLDPRFGQKLIESQTNQQVLALLDRTIDVYKKEARTNERLGRFIDRIGFDRFREKVLEETLVH
ncbi:Nitrite reductase (NAD(P)H) [Pelotomaculum sp. FP]|uniref:NAD(P)/FAD-dependent oxidoreductase n=1 Tax=Pelotomaculum sp. FP TaxID=261474 RepID=UPI0010664F1E|nr:NAD(P)/FAD-dependent oxidoreductase [Pelotomaculum sp. FP]TEB15641.1 Nitrite reductase (NAD(P)H) [Pelotomaculum sp. FP]